MAHGRIAERVPSQLGKYRILDTLGSGGMGVVYLGWDTVIERKVAVKTIRKDLVEPSASAEATARFRREAMAAGRLSHPGIVAVYDYGEDDDVAYIVMEYAPGEELWRYVSTHQPSPPQLAALLLQLLDALHYAHGAGVVHRDIKPANLLVAERLKITDFGIARINDSTLTQTGATMGTPAYMAPEQYMGTGVDSRIDLFAAGVILYEMLAGIPPFNGDSLEVLSYQICHTEPLPISARRPDLPVGTDALLQRALAKRKEERFQTAAEFAAALARLFGLGQAADTAQSRRMLGDAATVAVSSVPPPRDSLPVSTGVRAVTAAGISPEALERITRALAGYVGPIAKVLVKKANVDGASYEALCLRLSEKLTDGAEKSAFLRTLGVR